MYIARAGIENAHSSSLNTKAKPDFAFPSQKWLFFPDLGKKSDLAAWAVEGSWVQLAHRVGQCIVSTGRRSRLVLLPAERRAKGKKTISE